MTTSSSKEPEENKVSIHAFFVPLYLVVLAFFVLINTLAEIKPERKEEALGSVRETFADMYYEQPTLIVIPGSIGSAIPVEEFFAPLSNVAKEALKLVETETVELGQKMVISVPTESFFYKDNTTLRKNKVPFFKKLATELYKLNENARIEVELTIGSNPLPDSPNVLTSLALARAGVLVQTFIELGVPEKNIILGIIQDSSDNMTMSFFQRNSGEKIRF